MMSVAVTREPKLATTSPQLVFERDFGGSLGLGLQRYDVGPDGRFAFATPGTEIAATEMRVILGWLPELERLIAAPE